MAKTPATAAVPIAAARRLLSTPPPKPEVIVTKPPGGGTKPPGGGSSFFQRLAAFLTGAGLGCGVGYYHLSKASAGIVARSAPVAARKVERIPCEELISFANERAGGCVGVNETRGVFLNSF